MPIHVIEVTCKACGNSWPKDEYEELRPVDASIGWCPSCGEDGECEEVVIPERPYTDREGAKEYALKAMARLTPGGSEFFEAPVACENYIRSTRTSLQDMLKKAIIARKKIRNETIDACAKVIRGACPACGGSGVGGVDEDGQPDQECEYCGRPRSTILAMKEAQ